MSKLRNAFFISIPASVMLFMYETRVRNVDFLPQKLGNVKVLSSSRLWGLQETCNYHIFELEESVAQQITEKGSAYFEGDNKSRDISLRSGTNPYSEWRSTPVPESTRKESITADSAALCSKRDETTHRLNLILRSGKRGNSGYYIITLNKYGYIVVLPKERLAAYLYYDP